MIGGIENSGAMDMTAKALLKDVATGTPSADLDPSTADLLRRLTA